MRFETDEFIHPTTIVGRPEVKVRVKGSLPKGQISVALVELGERRRLTATPKFLMRGGQELGYRFGTDTLQEFVPDKKTKAKLITKGHMNLQNYKDMKRPEKIDADKFYDLDFLLQPTYYTLPSGSKLALIIYSTDEGMIWPILKLSSMRNNFLFKYFLIFTIASLFQLIIWNKSQCCGINAVT